MNVTNSLSNIQLTHSLPFEPSVYLRATDRLSVFLEKKKKKKKNLVSLFIDI